MTRSRSIQKCEAKNGKRNYCLPVFLRGFRPLGVFAGLDHGEAPMTTLPPHVIEAAAQSDAHFDGRGDLDKLGRADRDRYLSRAEAAISSALAALWQPIESAPKDRPIVLWHKVWDCEVTAQHRADDLAEIGLGADLCWLEKTKTTAWPADAFTHWREALPLPQEGKANDLG